MCACRGVILFTAKYEFSRSTVAAGFISANLTLTPGDANEKIYGLGQGEWNQGSSGCATPRDKQVVIPLIRNGQTIGLHQRKFHVRAHHPLAVPRTKAAKCVRVCVCVCGWVGDGHRFGIRFGVATRALQIARLSAAVDLI
jgi:hypothetical protein